MILTKRNHIKIICAHHMISSYYITIIRYVGRINLHLSMINIQSSWYRHLGREESFNFVYLIVLFFVCWCWGILKLLAMRVCRIIIILWFCFPLQMLFLVCPTINQISFNPCLLCINFLLCQTITFTIFNWNPLVTLLVWRYSSESNCLSLCRFYTWFLSSSQSSQSPLVWSLNHAFFLLDKPLPQNRDFLALQRCYLCQLRPKKLYQTFPLWSLQQMC